jgi:tetratricopeptide (TPR) repeat protein
MGAERRSSRAGIVVVLLAAMVSGGCATLSHPVSHLRARIELNQADRAYQARDYARALLGYQRVRGFYRGPEGLAPDPRLARALLHSGYAYMALQRAALGAERARLANRAVACFREVLRVDGNRARIEPRRLEEYMLTLYLDSGQPEQALKLLLAWHRRSPRDPVIAYRIAQHFAERGDVPGAMVWHRKRSAMQPTNPDIYYGLGVFTWQVSYYHRGLAADERAALVDEGLVALHKAVELRPEFYEGFTYINLLYREKAKLTTSRAEQRRFTELAEQNLKHALELRQQVTEAEGARSSQRT